MDLTAKTFVLFIWRILVQVLWDVTCWFITAFIKSANVLIQVNSTWRKQVWLEFLKLLILHSDPCGVCLSVFCFWLILLCHMDACACKRKPECYVKILLVTKCLVLMKSCQIGIFTLRHMGCFHFSLTGLFYCPLVGKRVKNEPTHSRQRFFFFQVLALFVFINFFVIKLFSIIQCNPVQCDGLEQYSWIVPECFSAALYPGRGGRYVQRCLCHNKVPVMTLDYKWH